MSTLLISLGCSPEFVVANYSSSTDGLLKVNNDHMGFYRVNHDATMWGDISRQLQTNHQVKLLLRLPLRWLMLLFTAGSAAVKTSSPENIFAILTHFDTIKADFEVVPWYRSSAMQGSTPLTQIRVCRNSPETGVHLLCC